MPALIPVVEIANDAYHLRIGRPNRKAHAWDALALDGVSAHGAVALVLCSFGVDVQVEIGNETWETIGVFDIGLRAVPQRQTQLVGGGIITLSGWKRADEKTLRPRFAHG